MNKRVSCLLLVVIFLATAFIPIQGAIEVDVNDAFDFDVIKSNRSISVGTNSASAEGYEIDGHHFNQGTSVNLNVTGILFGLVFYNISSNGYSEIGISSNLIFFLSVLTQIYQPMILIGEYGNASEWNQGVAEEDPGILIYPFLDNDTSTWNTLIDFTEEAQNGTLLDDYNGAEELETYGSYTNTTDLLIVEIFYERIYYHNLTDGDRILLAESDVKHNLKMAYNKTNGVMLGIKVKGTLSGASNESTIFMQYEQHTELQGYNLPDFEFGIIITPSTTPTNNTRLSPLHLGLIIGLGVGIPLTIGIVVTVILVKKKKG
jgi:hypothetical protein